MIIPTFNRLLVLSRAIESVKAQTFSGWELIVVDDGSTDGTHEWLSQQPVFGSGGQGRYFCTESKGVSSARNLGIKRAQGDWLAFLDSDDEWLPEKLFRQMSHIRTHLDHLIVHGEEIWVRRGQRVNPRRYHQKSGGRIFLPSIPRCVISPSAVMIHRQLFEQVGFFREDFPVCEDYELWLRITSRFEVGYIGDPLLIKYGGHEDQLSQKFKAMDYWRVKALVEQLSSQFLSAEEKTSCATTLQHKAEILLRGYQKYDNWTHYAEVKGYMDQAKTYLADVVQMPHLPRI